MSAKVGTVFTFGLARAMALTPAPRELRHWPKLPRLTHKH